MANKFLDAKVFANVMLLLLKNRLVAGKLVETRFTDQVTDQNGLKINVKRPARFVAKNGAPLALQDAVQGSVDISVTQYRNVHISYGDLEQIQSVNQLVHDTNMMSAASALAEDLEGFLQAKTLEFNNWVGAPGVEIATLADFNSGWVRVEDLAIPGENRCGMLTSQAAANMASFLVGTDVSNNNKTAFERARVPLISDIDVYHTQRIHGTTTGTRTDGTVNGASQNVNYRAVSETMSQDFDVTGLGANATVAAGDTFTIEDVYAVNPRTAEAYDYLQQFVVLEDKTASAGGAATLKISPPIIVAGTGTGTDQDVNTAFATCSAVPGTGDDVEWLGTASTTYKPNILFHKPAIQLVSARLPTPHTGTSAFVVDEGGTNIGIRYWRGSDISTGAHIHRWDMVYGATVVDRLRGVKLSGPPAL